MVRMSAKACSDTACRSGWPRFAQRSNRRARVSLRLGSMFVDPAGFTIRRGHAGCARAPPGGGDLAVGYLLADTVPEFRI